MRSPTLPHFALLGLVALSFAACSEQSPSIAGPGGPRLTVTPTNPFVTMDAGYTHACGLTSAGQGWCWGRNAAAQLGDSSAASTLVPVAVYHPSGVTFDRITAGNIHTCALTSAGQAYCWGYNADGRLGDSTFLNPLMPSAVLPLGGIAFASVSAGGAHTCGLDSSGQAYCWGTNTYGQIGDNTNSFRYGPTAVQHPMGVTFTSIAAGDKHTCALDGSSGQAYCWGYGGDGAVGNGSLLGSKVPVAVSQGGVTYTAATTEYNHSCGLDSSGQAYCWGLNGNGQLGDNSTTKRTSPVAVSQPGGVTFVQVATGGNHTCGLTSGGQDYCWGQNTYGQLGTGNTTQSLTPVAVSQGGVTYASAHTGGSQSFGLDSGGQAYGWGRNNFGQVGDGSSTNRTSPVAVSH